MKIFTTPQVRAADAYTIEHEPISSVDLMERAATRLYERVLELYPTATKYSIFCGTGNNGGDGLVLARLLETRVEKDKAARVFVVPLGKSQSADFKVNMERLHALNGTAGAPRVPVEEVTDATDLSALQDALQGTVIIDALLGSGATRAAGGLLASVIGVINACGAQHLAPRYTADMKPNPLAGSGGGGPVIAVDYPSGLFDANNTPENRATAVRAAHTITFQMPKLAFMMPANEGHIGRHHILDIGLHPAYLASVDTVHYTTELADAASLLKARKAHAHKGTNGHALICGGSKGKMGALALAGTAALRSGCGLLTLCPPPCGVGTIQALIPEALCEESPGTNPAVLHRPHENLLAYQAVGVGPGMGTSAEAKEFLTATLQRCKLQATPMVIDADAINLVAADAALLAEVPPGSVFTPHPKEFDRLFGVHGCREAQVETARAKARALRCAIVLKGQNSAVALPSGDVWFNTTGNCGMATGGSGDVLTGIVSSLLAQGYPCAHAAVLGVFLHGLAGDVAAARRSEEAMIAGDISDALGVAYATLHTQHREQHARM